MTAYEYRATGCGGGHWRLTEWTDRETALEDFEKASESWDAWAFERREPGDDETVQRKKSPDADEWIDVTDDMILVESAEVPA